MREVIRSMSTSGSYTTSTEYVRKSHREIPPAWLNYAAVLNSVRPVDLSRPFTYLELGCGSGASVISNARAWPQGDFHACDVNPAHIEAARTEIGEPGLANLTLYEAAFSDFPVAAVPEADFVVLHGVYSWVDAQAREAARRIIRNSVKPGGLVYVSYNCLPGWSAETPLRRLMLELADAGSGSATDRFSLALQSIRELSNAGARYFDANPLLKNAIGSYEDKPANIWSTNSWARSGIRSVRSTLPKTWPASICNWWGPQRSWTTTKPCC